MEQIKYSLYQENFFNEVKNTNNSILCIAAPGAGKSFVLQKSMELLNSSLQKCFVAFNKSICEEMKSKTSKIPNLVVQTLHSVGFKSLISTYRSKVDNYKYRKFLRDSLYLLSSQVTIDFSEEDQNTFINKTLKILDFARLDLATSVEEIENLALLHDIELNFDEAEVCLKLMEWGKENTKFVDFADMIYIPLVRDLKIQQYDIAYLDEAQDASKASIELFLRMKKENGRVIVASDPYQNIYFFQSASKDSFEKLKSIPNIKICPLSICYRCSNNVIKKANEIFGNEREIFAREGANDGIVEYKTSLNKQEILADSDTMFLARTNAPLVSLCMKCIQHGIKAYIEGRDLGKNLSFLIKKTKKQDLVDVFEVLNNELYKLQVYLANRLKISLDEAKNELSYINLEDKIKCLLFLSLGCEDTKDLLNNIDKIFSSEEKGIRFATVFKAKGLQASTVFILKPEQFPFKRAAKTEEAFYSEKCAQFVAYTRSINNLYFVECDIKDIKLD